MRHIIPPILVALFCLLALPANAQIAPTTARGSAALINYLDGKKNNESLTDAHTKKMQKNRQRVLALLQKQEQQRQARMHTSERTTSVTAERLIALSDYDYYAPDTVLNALGLIDTTVFKYSHGRGSEFNYNAMGYDPPSNPYDGGYLMGYLAVGLRITSSEPNYVPGVLCDSSRAWSSTVPASGIPIYSYGYADSSYEIYDANNNIVYSNDQLDPGMMEPDYIYINTYDISNNNVTSTSIDYDPTIPAYDTSDLTIQIFSGSQLVEDSVADYGGGGLFYPSYRLIYSYDGAGNLVLASDYDNSSGPWVEDEQYIMTYNADNTIKTDSETSFESGSWVSASADSFGYTAGVNYYTYLRTDYSGISGSSIDQSMITLKHIGSLGFPDTVFYYLYRNYSGGPPLYLYLQYKEVYTYDSYQNPKIVTTYHLNITDSTTGAGYYNATPDGYLYYYYETYTTSAVQNIAAATENIKIYPNPATNVLNILSTNQPINELTITNLFGQTLFTGNYNSEQIAVNVADFPAGLYLVRINGTEVRKFVKE